MKTIVLILMINSVQYKNFKKIKNDCLLFLRKKRARLKKRLNINFKVLLVIITRYYEI